MTVYSWGRGEDGQLGLGDTSDQHRPVPIDALAERRIVQIACGSGHTVVLTGAFFARRRSIHMGRGDDGRLGHGDNGWKFVPRLVEELRGKNIRQVTCGSYHTAAVTVSGDLYTWGGGMYGKLGHGNETGHSTPFLVETLKSMQSPHGRATGKQGRLHVGDKENGVSGHGDTEGHQYLPCPVEELRGKSIVQISACGFHTAALSEFGEVFTFGEGKFGRLGHNSERNQPVARFVEALAGKRVKQHGQLGHGDKVNKTVPTRVESLVEKLVVQITCGWSHTVALTDTGELGHNDTTKVTLPKLVDVLEGKRLLSWIPWRCCVPPC
ncbi:Regulator of chromosome condensation 1/beta-lactamase-inhibitor protein II [Phytophthora cactorum]|nr:Regulator of chromosome condensation 1/beta-lactamase-inhibitor protein II [Phytophthora cactorum]